MTEEYPSMTVKRNPNPGITTRHTRACATSTGGKRCTCRPTFLASVPTGRRGQRIRQSFPTLAAAKQWQTDQRRALLDGADLSSGRTVGDALEVFRAGLTDGTSRAKGKVAYKPSVAQSYAVCIDRLERLLDGDLAATRMRDLSPQLVQRVVDSLVAEGLSPSTVRNTLMPLRKVVASARKARTITLDPFVGLDLPAANEKPISIVSAEQAGRLLDALDDPARAYFACAFYAGLRRGEISALRWSDIDAPHVRVTGSYCHTSHKVTEPKSRHGRRTAPAAAQLFPILSEYRASLGDIDADAFVFPESGGKYRGKAMVGTCLRGDVVRARACESWKAVKLDRVTLQAARHTYASLMAAGGTDVYRLSEYMGHGSIEVTIKRYTHLYDEQRILDAQAMTDAVTRGDSRARREQVSG